MKIKEKRKEKEKEKEKNQERRAEGVKIGAVVRGERKRVSVARRRRHGAVGGPDGRIPTAMLHHRLGHRCVRKGGTRGAESTLSGGGGGGGGKCCACRRRGSCVRRQIAHPASWPHWIGAGGRRRRRRRRSSSSGHSKCGHRARRELLVRSVALYRMHGHGGYRSEGWRVIDGHGHGHVSRMSNQVWLVGLGVGVGLGGWMLALGSGSRKMPDARSYALAKPTLQETNSLLIASLACLRLRAILSSTCSCNI